MYFVRHTAMMQIARVPSGIYAEFSGTNSTGPKDS
jgi:hypothetical protein